MAERLEADLELSIAESLRAVQELRDEVETQLTQAVDAFTSSMADAVTSVPPVEIEADASAVSPEIEDAVSGADATTTVDADASAVPGEIESAVGGADVPAIPIEVDTSAAVADVEELASAVEGLGTEMGGIGGGGGGGGGIAGVDAFGAAAGAATGDVTALAGASAGLGASFAAPAAAGAALGAVIGVMAGEAIGALGATQRFEATLGSMADRVENLRDIEGLNTNLGDLALTLGSDDDALRNVVARLYELASASGVNEDGASRFVQQLTALGARAVALNPQLGDVGNVTDALSTALVRGGRFASKYGLDLNAAEINSRALADTGKTTTAELSFVEKAMAGAAIAAEKYGGNLDDVIARGAENAITTQRRLSQTIRETIEALGAPLVAPVFDLMESAEPTVAALGRVFSALGQAAIPIVTAALEGITPVLEVVASVIESLPPELVAAGAAWLAFGNPIAALIPLLGALDPDLVRILATLAGVVGVVYAVSKAWDVMSKTMGTSGIGIAVIAVGALVAGLSSASGRTEDLGENVAKIGKLSDENIGRAVEKVRELTAGAQFAGQNLDKLADDHLLRIWNQALEDNIGTAERFGQVLVNQGVLSQKEYNKALGEAIGAERQANTDRERATELIEGQSEAQKAAEDALKSYVDNALATVPSVGAVFDTTAEKLRQFFNAPVEVSPEALQAQLDEQITAIAGFQMRLAELYRLGLDNVAALVIEKGPVIGSALAQQALDAEPGVAAALETTLGQYGLATDNLEVFLTDTAGPRITGAWAAFHKQFPDITYEQYLAVQAASAGAIPGVAGAAGAVGSTAAARYADGIGAVDPATRTAVGSIHGIIQGSSSILGSPAHAAGLAVGSQMGSGIYSGLDHWAGRIAAKAADIVADAAAAARREAEAASPSKLFARLGRDMALGIAVGMDQGTSSVVAEAERVVRAAADITAATGATIGAAPFPNGGRLAGSGGGLAVQIDSLQVVMPGTDEATARRAGQQVADSIADGLARRQISVTTRGF